MTNCAQEGAISGHYSKGGWIKNEPHLILNLFEQQMEIDEAQVHKIIEEYYNCIDMSLKKQLGASANPIKDMLT